MISRPQVLSRRKFLGGAAGAVFVANIVPSYVLGGEGGLPPSERLNIACIGTAGRGGVHVNAVSDHGHNIVALCEVDKGHLDASSARFPAAKAYTDYRKMFDEMGKSIDAVTVGTPDHHHAFASMMAVKRGKHVYCEKPLTHSIWEARKVTEAAREAKIATQMGNQGMSEQGPRLLKEWLAAGAIGNVKEVHIWTDRPIWPQGLKERPPVMPVPPSLDWDMWVGPAPYREYHDSLHPFKWRGWWDFGTGALGDIGCHSMAPVFFALDLKYPTSIEAEISAPFNDCFPSSSIVRYDFPERGPMPPLRLTWYDGGKKPQRPEELEPERPFDGNGTLIVGDKGKIIYGAASPRIIPEAKMKEYKRPPETLPRIPEGDHHKDWFTACKGGRPACSNFEFSGPLSETVLAGNIAMRVGKRLEWDGPNMKAKNAPEADQYIRREYRKGWSLV